MCLKELKTMSKIYIGSKNPAKIAAVEEVFINYSIISQDVDSGVSCQPIGDEETIQGALNRALKLPQDSIRIGLEGGITLHNDTLYLINWGVLVDEDDNIFYAGGTRIPLPDDFKVLLENRKLELAELIDKYSNKTNVRSHEGAIGIFTCNVVQRKDIFVHICKLLYGQYLYHQGGKK